LIPHPAQCSSIMPTELEPQPGTTLLSALVEAAHRHGKATPIIEDSARQGFPELWVHKVVLVVATIPVLGSGKVDLRATEELVRQMRPLL
jgi:acyl-CoA synthetase (AMP-forming)/AMP-acid ligase II